MSKTISCDVDVDIDIMESTANRLGYNVQRNAPVRGYYGNITERADLVIQHGSSYQIGFSVDNYGKTTARYDDMAQATLNTIMPEYKHDYISKRLNNNGESFTRTESKDEIILYARRK